MIVNAKNSSKCRRCWWRFHRCRFERLANTLSNNSNNSSTSKAQQPNRRCLLSAFILIVAVLVMTATLLCTTANNLLWYLPMNSFQRQHRPRFTTTTTNFFDSTDLLIQKYDNILHELEQSQLRFYMYNETNIVQPDKVLEVLQRGGNQNNNPTSKKTKKMSKHRVKLWQRFYNDALFEIMVIAQFQQYQKLRTFHPEEADVIIIPIPIGAILLGRNQRQSYDVAFTTLTSSDVWFHRTKQGQRRLQGGGHDHVLLSHMGVAFNQETKREMETYGLSQWYPKLENVTIAQGYDVTACYHLTRKLSQQRQVQQSQHLHQWDFLPLFGTNQAAQTKYSFSIGIGATTDIPFVAASYRKFARAPLLLFYRTGMRYFKYQSTPFRHLLMELIRNATMVTGAATTLSLLSSSERTTFLKWLDTHSSIGYDLTPDRWIQDLTSSQFCLVVRGDTPHSHALLRAIKVGCLPVIISDYYLEYAPIFRSTLPRWDEFAIFINEQDFLEQPIACLERLRLWDLRDIQNKLQVLSKVQRIVLPDHPKSLFVPAFLKEALITATTKTSTSNSLSLASLTGSPL